MLSTDMMMFLFCSSDVLYCGKLKDHVRQVVQLLVVEGARPHISFETERLGLLLLYNLLLQLTGNRLQWNDTIS
jgi:hypothetical protein